jgi:5-methylthioadenosine/S-adenosylhomocysteine deaminase
MTAGHYFPEAPWEVVMKSGGLQFLKCLVVLLLTAQALQAQDEILSGTVVTPDKIIAKGWIVIRNGRIESIAEKPPAGTKLPTVETGGIIFPGFIDLHNHPMYDAFPRWHPPATFKNRYEWRDLPEYKKLVGTPGSELQKMNDQTFCDLDEYSEVKALIGGTTSITGISPRRGAAMPVPTCLLGLVRNLDWASGFYGTTVGHERVKNALGVTPHDMSEDDAVKLREELGSNEIDLLLIHLAEGSPQDLESTVEFLALKGRQLLGPHTAIIHGTALTVGDFRQMHSMDVALVWSPRSNMELYGVTTNISAALHEKVTVALSPDWSPTGSTNMLAELAYASRYSHEHLADLLTDEELFQMSTAIPSRIARIEEQVGTLRVGRYADLFVLKGDAAQPFVTLAHAKPQDVQLVLIGGVPLFGSEKLMSGFNVKSEAVDVCGAGMLLNSAALPAGTFADVQRRLEDDLKAYDIPLAPLAECP